MSVKKALFAYGALDSNARCRSISFERQSCYYLGVLLLSSFNIISSYPVKKAEATESLLE